jgi:hypothetical protein
MPVKGKAVIFGGGTVFHVRPHLSLSAIAYGGTAETLEHMFFHEGWDTDLALTRMAGGKMETNEDIRKHLEEKVLPDMNVKVVVMSAALCDFEGSIMETERLFGSFDRAPNMYDYHTTSSGKDQPRLKTAAGSAFMKLTPADKLINMIRKTRKDIFLVGFKTTAGASYKDQYRAGLELLKKNSCNLVLANDVHTRLNMIITPEQAIYGATQDRLQVLRELTEMVSARANLTFTRSTVVEGSAVPWASPDVPDALRKVVDHLIARGAYKTFLGKTVGHFAVKVGEGQFLTSIRKSNFNELDKTGLVRVETVGDDKVIAYGARPSVGGQSQRLVFSDHPGVDCIAHAHVVLRSDAPDNIPVRSQWQYECGSTQCGKNTSDGLKDFGGGIKAVMLDKHGPNVVFNRNVDPEQVIRFIDANWDLTRATDGVL